MSIRTALATPAFVLMLASGCSRGQHHESLSASAPIASFAREGSEKLPVLDGTLRVYLDYALRSHPRLRARYQSWRAAEHSVGAEDPIPDPMVGYGYAIMPMETIHGPQRHAVMIEQALPWSTFSGSGARVARAEIRVEEKEFAAEALLLARDIAESYWELWWLGEQTRIHEQHAALVRELYETTLRRIEVGAATLADASQVQLRVMRLTETIVVTTAEKQRAEASLRALVGITAEDSPAIADAPTGPRRPAEDDRALREAIRQHPALDRFAQLAEVRRRQADAARDRARPDFVVGIDFMKMGDVEFPALVDSHDALMARVAVSVPLWTGDEHAAASTARARANQAEAQREESLIMATSELEKTLSVIADTGRQIRHYQETLLPSARSVYDALVADYHTKRSSLAAMLLALGDVLELEQELARSRAQHEIAWARLHAVVGRPVSAQALAKESK